MKKRECLVVKFIFKFICKQWLMFLLMLISVLISSILGIAFPYAIKIVINIVAQHNGQSEDAFTLLIKPFVYVIAIWFGMELFRRFFGVLIIYTIPRFRANIRKYVFDYTSQHAIPFFFDQLTGSIANKISGLPRSCEIITMLALFSFIPFFISFLLSLVLVAKVNLFFLLVFSIWALVHLGMNVLFAKQCNLKSKSYADAINTLSGRIVDTFSNIISVKMFTGHVYEQQDFLKYQQEEMKTGKAALWAQEKIKFIQSGASFLMIVGIAYLLAVGWKAGTVSVGDFSLIFMLAFNLLGMAVAISYQTALLYQEVGSMKSAIEMVFRTYDVVDKENAKELDLLKGQITFDSVCFGYDENQKLFENLSFQIAEGEKVGLVGYSGAGKSTLIKLLLRLYDLNSGHILIDQQDITDLKQESLRQQIAVIPQEPLLFSRSIMDNIKYGRVDATEDEVINAAKLARCHDFIMQAPEQYKTIVGERGIKLSGGQRQRIAIARAFLKNSKILILDEATSSLDSDTERDIQESFDLLMNNRTTIVISHRLSTLSKMDRVLVFDNGKIIEQGSLSQLLQQEGVFKMMWENQLNGFLSAN